MKAKTKKTLLIIYPCNYSNCDSRIIYSTSDRSHIYTRETMHLTLPTRVL
ncbi:MAG: hypothetical protein ACOX2C_08740 [Bacteroidales bacterium]